MHTNDIMDFQVKVRKRGKDKEMDRRKKNGGMSQKHVRLQELEMERRKTSVPKAPKGHGCRKKKPRRK